MTTTSPFNPLVNPLLTDYYQISMYYAYWKNDRYDLPAVFETYFRKCPFKGNYAIFAGLKQVLAYIESFSITQEDLNQLRKSQESAGVMLDFLQDQEFCDHLMSIKLEEEPEYKDGYYQYRFRMTKRPLNPGETYCDLMPLLKVRAVQEGTVVFPHMPLIQLDGPLGLCQLMETTILNLTGFPSLLATNATRIAFLARHYKPQVQLLEFGLRRAQGPDGGMSASLYSWLAGFDGTSNMEAGKQFGIPIRGTHAHSYVGSYTGVVDCDRMMLKNLKTNQLEDFWLAVQDTKKELYSRGKIPFSEAELSELVAFASYAYAYPNGFSALVDTYDTLNSGIRNFLAVAGALHKFGYSPKGIRLDSGDLASLSKDVRGYFNVLTSIFGFKVNEYKIVASNNLNESSIQKLNTDGHDIDVFGIGTNLVTCEAQPAMGMVFKLVMIGDKSDKHTMHYVIKKSNEPEKVTIPGKKRVMRCVDQDGKNEFDLLLGESDRFTTGDNWVVDPVSGKEIQRFVFDGYPLTDKNPQEWKDIRARFTNSRKGFSEDLFKDKSNHPMYWGVHVYATQQQMLGNTKIGVKKDGRLDPKNGGVVYIAGPRMNCGGKGNGQ